MPIGISSMADLPGPQVIEQVCEALRLDAQTDGALELTFEIADGPILHTARVAMQFADVYRSSTLVNSSDNGIAVAELVSWTQDEVTQILGRLWPECPCDGSPIWLKNQDMGTWRCEATGHEAALGNLDVMFRGPSVPT